MKTIGIIAEYNPFHNGHLYQINKIKEQTGATQIVAVMSGDFVQRGCPAWTDKYLRTQLALSAGVDIVFELPTHFATASAETFALAGVSLLSSLGFVDGICFGSEYGNLAPLKKIAAFLLNPPETFHLQVKTLTTQGFSYPVARQKALTEHFNEEKLNMVSILSSPNNILAIEYLKALQLLNSPLIPYTIKRNDSGYHSDTIDNAFSSATAIRRQSFQTDILTDENFFSCVKSALPEVVLSLLRKQRSRFPLTENDFSDLLYYRLENLSASDISISDMTSELYHRIQNCLANFSNYSDFTTALKTKQYTYSRISRVLLHLLLNIYQDDFYFPIVNSTTDMQKHTISGKPDCNLPLVPYARLLGFSKPASRILRQEANIPVITKPADGVEQMTVFFSSAPKSYINYANRLFQKDILSANLYTQVQNTKCRLALPYEYHQKPVII